MKLELRDVTAKDMDILYEWANDPITRQHAFHTEPIPYETHRAWFVKVLADRNVVMLMLCMQTADKKAKEVGQIRLAIEDEEALISYSIAPQMRGQGLGSRMILMAEERLRESRFDVITCKAQVKYDNPASLRVFEKCGYDREEQEKYVEFTKRIRG